MSGIVNYLKTIIAAFNLKLEKKKYTEGDKLYFFKMSIFWGCGDGATRIFYPMFLILACLVSYILYLDKNLMNMSAGILTWIFISSILSAGVISFIVSGFMSDAISEYYSRKANNDL